MTERTYTTERYTAELDAETYIERFRRADYFLKLCQQCGNYGRRYGCPPYDHDPLTVLQRYDRVQIIGVKVTPHDKTLPLSAAGDMIRPVTTALNDILVSDRKVAGTACYTAPTGTVVHACMLYDVNLEALEQAITPSAAKLEKHAVASVRQRVRNLRDIRDLGGIETFRRLIEKQITKCQNK